MPMLNRSKIQFNFGGQPQSILGANKPIHKIVLPPPSSLPNSPENREKKSDKKIEASKERASDLIKKVEASLSSDLSSSVSQISERNIKAAGKNSDIYNLDGFL